MLGKLLKYDLKWVYKVIVVFYILAFIFSIIGRGLSQIKNSVVFDVTSQIVFGIAISMMINSLINCIMRLGARFIRNVYKDESYLTHTIPVSRKTIFASKVIAALISTFTTVVVIIGCLFICYYSKANLEALKQILELAASTYNTTVVNFLLLVSFIIFLEVLYIVLIGYIGIILGYKSNKNKMLRTLIIAFVLYFIMQALTLGFILGYGLINPNVMNLINTTEMIEIEAMKSVLYVGIGVYIVYIIFLYIFGQKQLEKGVNVD